MTDNTKHILCRPIAWGVVAAVVLILGGSVLACGGVPLLARWGDYLQALSDLFAIVDDLIVRILSTLLIAVGAVGTALYVLQKSCSGDPTGLTEFTKKQVSAHEFWKVLVLGGSLASGTFGFLEAYDLDEMDKPAEQELHQRGAEAEKVLAHWVLVVPAGTACRLDPLELGKNVDAKASCPVAFSVRAVVEDDAACPKVTVSRRGAKPVSYDMSPRSGFQSGNILAFRSIKVCERLVDAETGLKTIRVGKTKAIRVAASLTGGEGHPRVVVLGDSGCRDNAEQACDADNWGAAAVMQRAATVKADLVIHLGDFTYSHADNWEGWNAVFFRPGAGLLARAPLLAIHGNHEACNKHGHGATGYSLFFGLGDFTYCRPKAYDNWIENTYAVDVSDNLRLVVMDSAIARADEEGAQAVIKANCDDAKTRTLLTKSPPQKGAITELADDLAKSCRLTVPQLKAVGALAAGKRKAWMVTHVPLYGLEYLSDKDGNLIGETVPETSAMMLAAWRAAPVKALAGVLSGDRHNFQVVKTAGGPLQVTVGTGGVNLDPAPKSTSCRSPLDTKAVFTEKKPASGEVWQVCDDKEWGYLVADWKGASFDMKFHAVSP